MKQVIYILLLTILLTGTLFPQSWSGLGSGLNHEAYALDTYNGDLIAGGIFDTAGGISARRIARWNGTTWFNLGTGTSGGLLGIGTVRALTIFNGELIVGGYFTIAGGVNANRIAKWNGSTWSALGSGVSGSAPYVEALIVYNNEVIVGGSFDSAGGMPAHGLAKWNGSSWSPFGSGIAPNIGVYSFYIYNSNLIIGGTFNSVNGVPAVNIASYNGAVWSPLGSGLKGEIVKAIDSYQGDLIAGGRFDTAGTVPATNIARWNGSSWFAMGSGINNYVYALKVYAGELIAGGYFTVAGGVACNYVARWNGFFWQKLGPGTYNGTNNSVTCLFLYPVADPALIVGGYFTVAGNFPANRIARWGLPVGITPLNNGIPSNFRLYQNYPNPFNPTTNIKIELPKLSKVKLIVYDELGRNVSVLIDDELKAGSYEVRLNGTNLPSGVYYYELATDEYKETKKMSLLK